MNFKNLLDQYSEDGFVKVEGFFTESEVSDLVQGTHEVIQNIPPDEVLPPSFGASKSQLDEYYLRSGDKISYFFEPGAFNDAGSISVGDMKQAVTKVGYALHWWNPCFKKITFSSKIKDLLKNIGYKNPVVTDSQLIFKKSKPEEVSSPHQISTFLHTNPPTALGIWIPLADADTNTGCLWFLPGSHKGEIFQRFVRNPEKILTMSMKGEIPKTDDGLYVPLPVKKGDLVILHGSVLHTCGKNTLTKAHVSYSYHVVEGDEVYSAENWLQPTERLPFQSVYDN